MGQGDASGSPMLTLFQEVQLRLESDDKNIILIDRLRSLGTPVDQDQHARVIADCAMHLLQARRADAGRGGRELTRQAEGNLRDALVGWRER